MGRIKVINTSNIKKLKKSTNKKKSWRRAGEIDDLSNCLHQQADRSDYLDILGVEAVIDECDDVKETKANGRSSKQSTGTDVLLSLNYTIDTATGLKMTDRPKKNKLLKAHKNLGGLPNAIKSPYMGVDRRRKEHTLEHKLFLKERSLKSSHNAHKAEVKQHRAFTSLKKSKKARKQDQKLSFNDNLWDEPVPTMAQEFTAEAMDHTKRIMGVAAINNRGSKKMLTKIPAVPLPHPGLSYNPDVKSHQQLLQKAVKKEEKRAAVAKHLDSARTDKFPEGAIPVRLSEKMQDMNSEVKEKPGKLKKRALAATDDGDENMEDMPLPGKKTKERITHKRRLKQLRYAKQKREEAHVKAIKKKENEIYKLKEFARDLDSMDQSLKARLTKRMKRKEQLEQRPAKHFQEGDIEVALGTDLRSSLLNVQPSSNSVKSGLTHIYRRGLMPSHARSRNYKATSTYKSLTVRKNRKMQEKFTLEEMTVDEKKE